MTPVWFAQGTAALPATAELSRSPVRHKDFLNALPQYFGGNGCPASGLLVDTLNEQFRLHTDVCNMLGCLSRLHYDNGQSNLC
jgi:hypothetical protein